MLVLQLHVSIITRAQVVFYDVYLCALNVVSDIL